MASSTSKCRIGQRLRRAGTAVLLLATEAAASTAQELPPGGGPLPELRRGPNGQIEVVRPQAPVRAAPGPSETRPAAVAPKPAPARTGRDGSPAAAGRIPRGPPQPVITVEPQAPKVPDTTPRGAVVATYEVRMSNGSPFTGTVRFGPPHYDGNGVFALSGNRIIVNPKGPGLGPNKATITRYFTLETVP
jgi:hypothetical protein